MFDVITQAIALLQNIVNILFRSTDYLNTKVSNELDLLEKEDKVDFEIRCKELEKKLEARKAALNAE